MCQGISSLIHNRLSTWSTDPLAHWLCYEKSNLCVALPKRTESSVIRKKFSKILQRKKNRWIVRKICCFLSNREALIRVLTTGWLHCASKIIPDESLGLNVAIQRFCVLCRFRAKTTIIIAETKSSVHYAYGGKIPDHQNKDRPVATLGNAARKNFSQFLRNLCNRFKSSLF